MRGSCERGTSAVEVAILAPLVVVLLGALVYVGDLGTVRIRQRELVRLAAWEMTAHALSDERDRSHRARWEQAAARADAEARRLAGGGVVAGAMAAGRLESVALRPLGLEGNERIQRPAAPEGAAALLEAVGSLLRGAAGLHRDLLAAQGFNVAHVGVEAAVGVEVRSTGLLPELPGPLRPAAARLALQVDTWAVDDGSDVPLPGLATDLGRQVARLAHLGLSERLGGEQAGEAARWIPIALRAPVVSMNYLPPASDRSPVGCGGSDPLARTGRWENGPAVGTPQDGMAPVRCFDTLPIEANGFGPGGGRAGDPLWRALRRRGPHFMGCDRRGGCEERGEAPWVAASSR